MLIGDALLRSCSNYPDKLALKDEYGKYFPPGQSFTYAELNTAVNRLANSLLSLGLRPGDRVSVQTGTGLGHLLPLLALTKAGMAIAPIDRTYLAEEIAYQVNDAESAAFILDEDIYEERVKGIRAGLTSLKFIVTLGPQKLGDEDFENLLSAGSPDEPDVCVNEDDVATLIYTSGTTGRPKGTPLTHRNWSHSALAWYAELGIHPYTRWLLVLPMHTSGGTGLALCSAGRGCSLTVSPPDPAKVLDLITKERITFIQFSPTLLANVIRHPEAPKADFSHIEHWFTSAAPISAELLREGASFLGEAFVQLYGTTETGLLGTVLRPEEVSLTGPKAKRLTSCGRACVGYQTKVVDDAGNEVGRGGTGELAIKGDGVGRGYWKQPDAKDFRDGWWYSGDIVQVDEDGFYYVIDRKKDMILSGGTNIYPREVEDVIAAHPAVDLVAVIGVPDEKWGESVKAVVVLRDGESATEAELIDWCKDRLASYKKPRSVDFVSMADMPMLGAGYKILKRELRDRYRIQYEQARQRTVQSWGSV
jgi:long-chain acyl-CoA synthetase